MKRSTLLKSSRARFRRDRNRFSVYGGRRLQRLHVEPLEDRRMLSITVNTEWDVVDPYDGKTSLREAIQLAGPSDNSIVFDESLNGGTIFLDAAYGEMLINESLTIDATTLLGGITIDASYVDPTPTVNNGDGSRIFNIDDGNATNQMIVSIRGLTLTGGDVSGEGGAIFNSEKLTMALCEISHNSAYYGGGIYSRDGAFVNMTGTAILSNSAVLHGGGIHNGGVGGEFIVIDSTIDANEAGGWGGGIVNYSDGANLSVTGSTISNNSAGDFGGGIANMHASSVSVIDCTVRDNQAEGGGGIYSYQGDVTMQVATIRDNRAEDGGGVYNNDGTLIVTAGTISHNTAGSTSGQYGGGIYNYSGTATVSSSTIDDNSAYIGGGIANDRGTVTVDTSTISQNEAGYVGGGLYTYLASGPISVVHSTIALNRAATGGSGNGGGIYVHTSPVSIDHTIVADNFTGTTPQDVSNNVGARYSLIGTNLWANITDNGGNMIGTTTPIDLLLGPLADNGGPTWTHALLPGSPAINAGDPGYPIAVEDYDQRNGPFGRLYAGRIDIGAYERQTVTGLSLVVNTLEDESDGIYDGPGELSLREAIGLANGSVNPYGVDTGETITFAPELFAGGAGKILLRLGELVISEGMSIQGPGANLLTIDASGNDPTADSTLDDGDDTNDGDGSRIFNVDDGNSTALQSVSLICLALSGGDADGHGGAIRNKEHLAITNCKIQGNSSKQAAGAIYSSGESRDYGNILTINNSTIRNNAARWEGGGVFVQYGQSSVTESAISGNTAMEGGGIYMTAAHQSLTIVSSTVDGNSADWGGGIRNNGGDLAIISSAVANNAADFGGGILNFGNLTVTGCTIQGNTAALSEGGGIYTATSSDFETMQTRVLNSTISGNDALAGGGIFNAGGLTVIEHCTVTFNDASNGQGSGVACSGDEYTRTEFYSTIVAGNFHSDVDRVDGELNASVFSHGFNLIGDGSATYAFHPTIGDLIAIDDPLLAPLAENGGSTMTHALLTGSQAIDAGGLTSAPLLVPNDQRGAPFSRVKDGNGNGEARIDIGAYEVQTLWLTVDTKSDESNNNFTTGDLSLREALEITNANPGDDSIGFEVFAPSSDPIRLTHGELVISDSVWIDGFGWPITIDAASNGRIFNVDDGDGSNFADVRIDEITLTGGYAEVGGAIYNAENLLIVGLTIDANTATNAGGGIAAVFGSLVVEQSTIRNNVALNGGGISNWRSDLMILNSTIQQNSAIDAGGGIHNQWDAMLTGATVYGNHAEGYGGGIFNGTEWANMAVDSSVIAGNTTANRGGGIFNYDGNLAVEFSTIDHNVAAISGGGLYSTTADWSESAPPLTKTLINSSTISANTSSARGGGVVNNSGLTQIRFSTVTGNEAPVDSGGGVVTHGISDARTEFYSTIVAGNIGSDVGRFVWEGEPEPGSVISLGYNLVGIGNALDAFNSSIGDLVSLDPMLGPLADNGGPRWTHALMPGSPALDAGDPSILWEPDRFDQRGYARVRDSNGDDYVYIDIGAFEAQDLLAPLLGDYNYDRSVDAADYVVWRKMLGSPVYDVYAGADGNGNGRVDPDDYGVWRANFGNVALSPGAGIGATLPLGPVESTAANSNAVVARLMPATVVDITAAPANQTASPRLPLQAGWEAYGRMPVRSSGAGPFSVCAAGRAAVDAICDSAAVRLRAASLAIDLRKETDQQVQPADDPWPTLTFGDTNVVDSPIIWSDDVFDLIGSQEKFDSNF